MTPTEYTAKLAELLELDAGNPWFQSVAHRYLRDGFPPERAASYLKKYWGTDNGRAE